MPLLRIAHAFALALVFCTASTAFSAETLIPFGAVWKYLDDGSDPGSGWTAPAFDDTAWDSGPAELGYGDGDESTVVSYGPDSANKYITTYFRSQFLVADPSAFDGLQLRLLRDDGALVFLNGTEVARSSLPIGPIAAGTLAAETVDDSEETALHLSILDPALLVAGLNTLAVEIHQRSVSSSDISFDLELSAHTPADPIAILRGPYLQRVGPERAVIRWRANAFTDSRASVGLTPGALDLAIADSTLAADHSIEFLGLTADTEYYYAVGTTSAWLMGPSATLSFRTAPAPAVVEPLRIWAIGDSGTADSSAASVRDAYLALAGASDTHVWLMLGDNAYDAGNDSDYQAAVFDMYPSLLRTVPLWPTLGNHDGRTTSSLAGTGPYFEIFTLPTAGEVGGLPSGTEAYYSFDHGNVHFICLDSEGSDRSVGSAMLTWLESDLASTDREWVIAFWHHPPYSDGSHDSDDPLDSGGRMRDMREHVLPILEAGGVDLVLCGHSHSYERSMLLDGHYGVSATLTPAMIVDDGDGDPTGDGAYVKPSAGLAPHEGAVYVVAGSSGKTDAAPLAHPVMVVGIAVLGSVVIDVTGDRLDARFLRSTGAIADRFTIRKGPYSFIRADANGDSAFNIADAIAVLSHLFQSLAVPCRAALDANDDGAVNIADAVHQLSTLFSGGAPPPPPHPGCGVDPTPDALGCENPVCL
ncbi:MAG: metallophosphoesterase [Planctomycetota bacterium]